MAHPKRRQSTTRRNKRRTHYTAAASIPQLATCPTTGETHVYHRAYWSEGKLYYKGNVVMEKNTDVEA